MKFKVSVVCPVFNGAAVLPVAIASWRAQTTPFGELIVVDDGSIDGSSGVAQKLGARVIRFDKNRGRGAARAEATQAASGEFVLFADAHNALEPNFLERALPEFDDLAVVGVVGTWHDPEPQGVLGRWRARHLFRCLSDSGRPVNGRTLSTHACILRRSAVLDAGNFDKNYRSDEDTELGKRMSAAGGRFVHSLSCRVRPLAANTWLELVERHTRWYVRADERLSVRWYANWLIYALKVMAIKDWRAHDPLALGLSLWLPQAMAWRLARRRRSE
jgi:glycosyltransferase involved in cell wall biosynthesis